MTRLKEGVIENFKESLAPSQFDLETPGVRYKGDISISTDAMKEMGVVSTNTHLSATAEFTCSRCLKEFGGVIERDFSIQYPLDKSDQFIDISQEIRQEVILSYPVKFLCQPDCRGLCPKCGQDLNSGECNCQMRM